MQKQCRQQVLASASPLNALETNPGVDYSTASLQAQGQGRLKLFNISFPLNLEDAVTTLVS